MTPLLSARSGPVTERTSHILEQAVGALARPQNRNITTAPDTQLEPMSPAVLVAVVLDAAH